MCVAPKNAVVKKRCEIPSIGQKMTVMVAKAKGKNFNNDNSGEYVLPSSSFTRIWYQIHLNYRYQNFCL